MVVSGRGRCAVCGGKLPARGDTRGRKAVYCSSACRSSAHRKRVADEHARALEEARSQLVLDVRDPTERLIEATEVVGEVTHFVASGARLSPVEVRVVDAARTLVEAVEGCDGERSGRKNPPAKWR